MTQIEYDAMPLEEVLEIAQIVVRARPAEPAGEFEKLRLDKSGNKLVVLLPNGRTVTEVDKNGSLMTWNDKADYVPSRRKRHFQVFEVVAGEVKGKTICVLDAEWANEITSTILYEYGGLGESPIYTSYESATQKKVTGEGERILFLVRDTKDPDCLREAVSGAYEATSELERVRKLLTGAKSGSTPVPDP